jgi:ribosomal protein L7/L12
VFWLDTIFVLTRKKSEYPYPIDKNTGSITLPAAFEEELQGLVSREKKTEAVKRVTHLTGADLRTAKDYVDALVTGSEEPSG